MSDGNLNYGSYLKVDELTALQDPISDTHGKPAHIEMLYIVVHQVYELWFKEILHELDSVIEMFESDYVNERNIGEAVRRVRRVTAIQELLVEQIKVLETMTALEFLDFRHYLGTASGFQSFQFRLLENRLGLRPEDRIPYGEKSYLEHFSEEKQAELKATESAPSMFSVVAAWLERTPFLELQGFRFVEEYGAAVERMLGEEARLESGLPKEEADARTVAREATKESFAEFLSEEKHEQLRERGHRRLSFQAMMAALFIKLYREEPILQLPFRLLETLVEIDENLMLWRSRHAVMVHRMLGRKMGTGQSSGYDYLKRTVEKSRIFSDFFNVSTFMIPRSSIPELPAELKRSLGFYYSTESP